MAKAKENDVYSNRSGISCFRDCSEKPPIDDGRCDNLDRLFDGFGEVK